MLDDKLREIVEGAIKQTVATASTPKDTVLSKLRANYKYKGRKPTSIRWDRNEMGGWLLMKFSDQPRVVIEDASPILFYDAPKALFGRIHNPLCQTFKEGEGNRHDYHMTDDGKFDKDTCFIDGAEYHQLRMTRHTFNEYDYLREVLNGN